MSEEAKASLAKQFLTADERIVARIAEVEGDKRCCRVFRNTTTRPEKTYRLQQAVRYDRTDEGWTKAIGVHQRKREVSKVETPDTTPVALRRGPPAEDELFSFVETTPMKELTRMVLRGERLKKVTEKQAVEVKPEPTQEELQKSKEDNYKQQQLQQTLAWLLG